MASLGYCGGVLLSGSTFGSVDASESGVRSWGSCGGDVLLFGGCVGVSIGVVAIDGDMGLGGSGVCVLEVGFVGIAFGDDMGMGGVVNGGGGCTGGGVGVGGVGGGVGGLGVSVGVGFSCAISKWVGSGGMGILVGGAYSIYP